MIPTAIVTLRSLRSVVRPVDISDGERKRIRRDCGKKSIDEHIVVSCSIEIVFTTVFSLLKDLVRDDPLRDHHVRFNFSIARSVRVISTAQL